MDDHITNDASGRTRPADFTFTFEYHEGSVPPQFYYEYTIEVSSDGSGEIRYLPDYPQNHPEELVELFNVSQPEMDRLYMVMKVLGLLHPVWQPSRTGTLGGPVARLQVISGGRVFDVRRPVSQNDAEGLEKLYEMIRAVVPQTIWDKIEQLKTS